MITSFLIIQCVILVCLFYHITRERKKLGRQITHCTQPRPYHNQLRNPLLSVSGWADRPAHVVISLPKCGGNTLANTVRNAFPRHSVAYVHIISRKGMEHAMNLWLGDRPLASGSQATRGHLNETREVRMMIEEQRERYGRPVGYYLCGVRDPVALAVSGYFQAFTTIEELQKLTVQQVKHEILNVHPVLTKLAFFEGGFDGWFNREILDVLGVDVFNRAFDHEKGHVLFRQGGVNVLVIRQENFDSLPTALGELYDLPARMFPVENANRAQDKVFGRIYKEMVSKLKFEGGLLDELYESRYARHFYTPTELSAFRLRWQQE
ncbi:MAG TPA: hypothetical protein DDZ88_00025 [Verrucomicrobiales bacterium]|nr:hypothetical protein [Verrucomicrobiales bacterium]